MLGMEGYIMTDAPSVNGSMMVFLSGKPHCPASALTKKPSSPRWYDSLTPIGGQSVGFVPKFYCSQTQSAHHLQRWPSSLLLFFVISGLTVMKECHACTRSRQHCHEQPNVDLSVEQRTVASFDYYFLAIMWTPWPALSVVKTSVLASFVMPGRI